MRSRWTIMGLVLACAGCSSDDDSGKGSGQLATGGAGNVDGSAGASGGSAGAAGSPTYSNGGAAVSCTTNEDCVPSAYVKPIASVDDCYCVTCPEVALNVTTDDERLAAWQEYCTNWTPPNNPSGCALVKCVAPPESVCKDGVCALID